MKVHVDYENIRADHASRLRMNREYSQCIYTASQIKIYIVNPYNLDVPSIYIHSIYALKMVNQSDNKLKLKCNSIFLIISFIFPGLDIICTMFN